MERKMHVVRAAQISSPKISVLPSFLDFSSCVGWPSTYTQATAKFYWDILVQLSFFEGNSESACGALRKSIDCQVSKLRRFTPPVAHPFFFFFRKKKPIGQSKNSRTIRKRKIPAGKSDWRAGKGGKRGASFIVFSIAKCMNKAADRSGCPVSNPDPNNTIGLLHYQAISDLIIIIFFCKIKMAKVRNQNSNGKVVKTNGQKLPVSPVVIYLVPPNDYVTSH